MNTNVYHDNITAKTFKTQIMKTVKLGLNWL